MIGPRYGEPCFCEACTIAGMRGKRLIEVARGRWAHGRDLARLYERLRKLDEQFVRSRPLEGR
jgi:hypothetical protein